MQAQLHPIQLRFVAVRELHIKTFYPPGSSIKYSSAEAQLQINDAALDPETNLIQVGLVFQSGREQDPTDAELATMRSTQEQPFRLMVHIVAEFYVDVTKFPAEKVPLWAKVNAPGLMYPFLREHVFALTARCGFNPIILPLIHLPTIQRKEVLPLQPEALEVVGASD
ncbi:MAG: protein-export chaperone SecB [Chthoniobacter sp.]